MSWVDDNRKHRDESDPCPIADTPGNYHFELICEDCDVRRASRKTLGEAEYLYRQGRMSQSTYEAYDHVFVLLSPYRADPAPLLDSDVRRVARKLLKVRGLPVPDSLK